MNRFVSATAFAVASCVVPVLSHAASLDLATVMASLNLVVLEDLNAAAVNHVEGTTYVGGSLTSGTFYANSRNMADATLGGVSGDLIVGGSIHTSLNNGGGTTVIAGGSYTGATTGAGITVTQGVGTNTVGGVPVAEMTGLFTTLSDDLAALATTTAFVSGDSNNVVLNSGAGIDGVAVLNLSATQANALLGGTATIDFAVQAGVSLIINVQTLANFNVTANVNNNAGATDVLFNFYAATDHLSFGGGPFNASVLAAYANVYSPAGGTRGLFVAESMTLGGEIRPFNGNITYTGDLPAAAPVPVPAALPLALAAFGALGLLRPRRI